MYKYKIKVDKELAEILLAASKEKNVSVEQFIAQILNKYLVPAHTIDQEAMAQGYQDMAQLNLELSN